MRERTASDIPREWGEITPEWMTAALSDRHPGAKVGSAELVSSDSGSNRRARFELTYASGTGPARVFLKTEGEHRLVHSRNGNLFNEAQLFASGVPLPLDAPLVYKVLINRPALDFMIVMEDVTTRGADPRDATRPMTVDQVADGVRSLARLHAQYWGFSGATHPGLTWVQTWAPTEGFLVGPRKRIPTGLERGGGRFPDAVTRRGPYGIVEMLAQYLRSLSQEPMTLLHGDAHIGNTYVLPHDRVGFLDWQVLRRGGWSHDVGYFITGALTIEDRRRHEGDLLAEYLRMLDSGGNERPSAEGAWLRYRASAAYGLAIWLSTLGTDGYQSREVSLTLAERYATAFTDLDTAKVLATSP